MYAIWIGIMAVGAVIWLIGFLMSRRAFAAAVGGGGVKEPIEIELGPEEAGKEIARRLTGQSSGLSVRVLACTANELNARVNLYPGVAAGALAQDPDRGAMLKCRLTSTMKGTRVSWSIDTRPLTGMLETATYIVLGLGVLALAAAAFIFPLWVMPHPEPAVRWQVVQTVQALHLQWPPIMLAFLARRRRVLVEARVGDLFANMTFL
jgi:hypothetical protein